MHRYVKEFANDVKSILKGDGKNGTAEEYVKLAEKIAEIERIVGRCQRGSYTSLQAIEMIVDMVREG